MPINYRTQTHYGEDLPNGGNISIYYPEDNQWYDNVHPTQLLEFSELSDVNGLCVVKYYNTIFERCFWRNYGQNPIDCVWREYSEYVISQPSFTNSGTRKEEKDESVTWIVIEEEEEED